MFSDFQLTEPMTMATDYLLAGQSLAHAFSLSRRARPRPAPKLWTAAFGVTAAAALAGGTAHGFALHLGKHGRPMIWGLTGTGIAGSAALMLAAGVRSAQRPAVRDRERRRSGKRWLIRGILSTAAGLFVQRSGWSLHRQFNHNDLYHVIQMAGLYCFYRGAAALEGQKD